MQKKKFLEKNYQKKYIFSQLLETIIRKKQIRKKELEKTMLEKMNLKKCRTINHTYQIFTKIKSNTYN